jgi:hypothetical protein
MAETIGSLIDKISIIELKIFHMKQQVERADVTQQHREDCALRLEIMKQQQADLRAELSESAAGVLDGTRTLKVYRQFKMYNDPAYKAKQ